MTLLITIFILGIYFISPFVGKLALLIVNLSVPDPIPYVDEIIMWLGLLSKLSMLADIAVFVAKFKYAILLILFCILLVLVF